MHLLPRFKSTARSLPEKEILGLEPHQLYPDGRGLSADFFLNQKHAFLTRETPIVSIGSCFAREIKDYLVRNGFNYLQTATGPNARHGSAAWDRVYNTFCLRQEFRRALDKFQPEEKYWESSGRYLDPYRKKVSWDSLAQADEELERHRATAHEAFTRAHVLIITVGLTEIWYSRLDGSVYFQVPPPNVFKKETHAFRNSTVDENLANLEGIHALMQAANPDCKIVITVSPVPLRATFHDRNVVISNTLSKATLVVATQTFVTRHDNVFYFPSYELVTAGIRKAFEPDNRHVRRRTVDAIMRVFEEMFVAD